MEQLPLPIQGTFTYKRHTGSSGDFEPSAAATGFHTKSYLEMEAARQLREEHCRMVAQMRRSQVLRHLPFD
jgi:hypothetical protein